ncbi:hypothetical protein ACFWOB_42585 [Streptomyces sp. NPDC058420]|uniref:hypothetical protein n=1 Tax=Streptomyces sp. NPDC058420 TaxID=3346489 RepID=UPI00364C3CB7
MDQGLAAVLGAAVGVSGTAITGLLGYVAARKQAPDQGRIEHERQLRAERRETYLAYLEWMQPANDFGALERGDQTPEALEAVRLKLVEAHKHLYALKPRVDLCGPREVAAAASAVWMETYELSIALERRVQGHAPAAEVTGRWFECAEASRRFVEAVNTEMERKPR